VNSKQQKTLLDMFGIRRLKDNKQRFAGWLFTVYCLLSAGTHRTGADLANKIRA
jgi:hypothetical protein